MANVARQQTILSLAYCQTMECLLLAIEVILISGIRHARPRQLYEKATLDALLSQQVHFCPLFFTNLLRLQFSPRHCTPTPHRTRCRQRVTHCSRALYSNTSTNVHKVIISFVRCNLSIPSINNTTLRIRRRLATIIDNLCAFSRCMDA